jgi:hypothetical protein
MLPIVFDPGRQRFVGTWGRLDDEPPLDLRRRAGRKWACADPPLGGAGHGRTDAQLRYQDVIEFLSDDHRTLTGKVQNADGQWQDRMVVHYRRK